MKTFKQFLNESQWMYHGSPSEVKGGLKPDRSEYMIDRAIGSHFAADPNVSKKFSAGLHGVLYRTKVPPRSQIEKIPQKKMKYTKKFEYPNPGNKGGYHTDQHIIGAHVSSTVFKQPENKQMFKDWFKNSRKVDDNEAERVHTALSQGQHVTHDKFTTNSFHHFMGNFDAGLHQQPHPGFKQDVINKYLDIQKKRGIKGLSYKNTSPMETEPNKKGIRSNKSYVIFHPKHLNLEKVNENI